MQVQKIPSKACCGTSNLTLQISSSVPRSLSETLKKEKYFLIESMLKNGYLYAKKDGLIVTGIFGSNKLSIVCQGASCQFQIEHLIKLLEKL